MGGGACGAAGDGRCVCTACTIKEADVKGGARVSAARCGIN
eukprot:gene7685-6271_t